MVYVVKTGVLDVVVDIGLRDWIFSLRSEDTFKSDSECDLPSCDDFSPINVPEGKSETFSNPLFDSNGDFTFNDDESLASYENVPEVNVGSHNELSLEANDDIGLDSKEKIMEKILYDAPIEIVDFQGQDSL
ncbi:hypothetical protein Tco_0032234 [Tanacetum coccineum]